MAQALRQETAPGLAKHLAYCARAYALDLALTAAIFIAVSIAAGRVWRFPFDDEVYNLAQYERLPFIKLALYYLAGNDVHPPLAYVFGDALHLAGLSEPGMRLVSLALTCASLVLLQLVALALVSERRDIAPPTRLAAILLFGLNALAVSQGDALRWYPLFACEAALFVLFALAGDAVRFRIAAAIALGLALSTNYLALALALPFAVYRYVLQRRFAWRSDAAFWGVAALFGSLGAISLAALLLRHAPLIASQIGPNPVVALATDLLGFFGGHALGLSQAWMVVPAMAIAAGAIVLTIHRARRDDPAHLLILLLLMALLLPLGGFAKPRSFLYLAPVLACVLTLAFDRVAARRPLLAILALAVNVAISGMAIAAVAHSDRPFKRNAAVPYGEMLDFIRRNAEGRVLVLSTDPVLLWLIAHAPGIGQVCASYFLRSPCAREHAAADMVVVVSGHSHLSDRPAAMRRFDAAVEDATRGRRQRASMRAGVDKDAPLKSRLTGVPLDEAILTLRLYR